MISLFFALVVGQAGAQTTAPAPVPSQPVVVKRVAGPVGWSQLRARVMRNPDSRQNASISGADYQILAVFTTAPLKHQECPAGTMPRSAVYFTLPVAAKKSFDIYPVRLTYGCGVAPDGAPAHDLLTIDADGDGNIMDISLWDASLGLLVHPTAEPKPVAGDTQTSNLQTVLDRLVNHLIAAP